MSWDLNTYKEEQNICITSQNSFKPVFCSSFSSFKPRQWQIDAYNAWGNSFQRATVTAATGTGKTKLAMMIIEKNMSSNFLIVVPTIVLQKQWYDEIKSLFPLLQIGLVGDGNKDFSKQITIAVVNSIRDEVIAKDILIMDETHRYASDENIKFLLHGVFNKVLALTATIKRQDGQHHLITKTFPVVYNISQENSIDAGYLSKYKIINKGVELTKEEQLIYNEMQSLIDNNMSHFSSYPAMMKVLKTSGWNGEKQKALKANKGYNGRKKIINNSENKWKEAIQIVKENKGNKIIIFGELKKVADKIYKILKKEGFKVGLYHSGLKPKDKKEMIEKYVSNEYSIMVTVKALDEGLDVKQCDIGIIVSGNSTDRQGIQRAGRILRASEGKEYARLYQIYLPGTQDENWLKMRLKGLKGASEIIYI